LFYNQHCCTDIKFDIYSKITKLVPHFNEMTMRRNQVIFLIGIALFALSFILFYLNIIGAQLAYFIVLLSFVMIVSPLVIYLFNKLN